MQKHVEDDGDLHLVINDAGQFLVVCAACKKSWLGNLDLTGQTPPEAADKLIESLATNPQLSESLSIDLSSL